MPQPTQAPKNAPVDQINPQPEPVQPEKEPGNKPQQEPGNTPATPQAERPPRGEEGTTSNPDTCGCGPEVVKEVHGL